MRWGRAAALAALLAARPAGAVSPEQKHGREIYRRGVAAGEPITIRMSGSELDLPASRFACIACHGYRGQGALEGSVRVPPIHRLALSSDRDGWNRPRTPYTAELLGRAITSGLNAAGRPLHRAMPRYRMTAAQLGGLVAYLRILNTAEDQDAGVTESAVRFGAALPLSGRAAALGAATRSRIERVFSRVNAEGGVYGRRLELVTADAGSDGAETAMTKLLGQDELFALLASSAPGDPGALDDRMRREGVPLVGPLGFSSGEPPDARADVFHFVPPLTDQARTLALHLTTAQRWRRPVVIHPGTAQETAAAEGLWSSSFISKWSYAPGAFRADAALDFLLRQQADAVLFLGSGKDLRALTARLSEERLTPAVLAPPLEIEDTDSSIAPAFQGEMYLAAPAREGQFPISAAVGEAAAEIAIEALKRAGRLLSRPGFARALAAMRDAESGAYDGAPLAAGFKIEPSGAYIVRLDPRSGRFSAVTGWLTPPQPLTPAPFLKF